MNVTMPFSVTEQYNYQDLLDEAIELIISADAQLGPKEHTSDVALEELVAPLRKLKEAQAYFAPDLTVQQLSELDFKAHRMKPSPIVQRWMRTHRLYMVQIPVTLKPSFGWAFTRLECGVVFEGEESGLQPKVHDIYPDDVWTDILKVQTHLKLGLNAELSFRAEMAPTEAAFLALSGEAQAKLAAVAGGAVQFLVGPFNCDVRRPLVLGRGREGSNVFWQLDGQEYVQREEPFLAVILRVPNETGPINAQGRLIAYHKFDFLGAHLVDWKGVFRDKLRSFFGKGIPLESAVIWRNAIS
jgi:hypothetical protein